jgi:hypothetical protein
MTCPAHCRLKGGGGCLVERENCGCKIQLQDLTFYVLSDVLRVGFRVGFRVGLGHSDLQGRRARLRDLSLGLR